VTSPPGFTQDDHNRAFDGLDRGEQENASLDDPSGLGGDPGTTRERPMRPWENKIEVKRENGFWSVFVCGQRCVDRESFAVADRVRYHLEHPEEYDNSESADVADAIRKHFEGEE